MHLSYFECYTIALLIVLAIEGITDCVKEITYRIDRKIKKKREKESSKKSMYTW